MQTPLPSLSLSHPDSRTFSGPLTALFSVTLHAVVLVAVIVPPLLLDRSMPDVDTMARIFEMPAGLAAPPIVSTLATGLRGPARPVARTVSPRSGLVFAVDPLSTIRPDDISRFGPPGDGFEGGDPDGAPDGVGVVVPDLPLIAPPPPPKLIRITVAPPKPIVRIAPEYPSLPLALRLSAVVVLEAEVDAHGNVRTVKVVRGHPLFDAAAIEAVAQWRYQPMLSNGEPTGFVLTVTIDFEAR